jgi:hypothetical protein
MLKGKAAIVGGSSKGLGRAYEDGARSPASPENGHQKLHREPSGIPAARDQLTEE